EAEMQPLLVHRALFDLDVRGLEGVVERGLEGCVHLHGGACPGHLDRRHVAEQVGRGVDEADDQRDRDDRVLPEGVLVHYEASLIVPLGNSVVTAERCTWMVVSGAISRLT